MQVRAYEESLNGDALPEHISNVIDVTLEQDVSAIHTNLLIEAAGSSQTRHLLVKEQPLHSKYCVAALFATLCIMGNLLFLAYMLQ